MHQCCIGAECAPGDGPLDDSPTRVDGALGMHLPEELENYRRPLPAARHDIAMAKAAGVNTFACLLGDHHLPKSAYASMIHAMFDAAQEDGSFKVSVDIWSDFAKADAVERLANTLAILKERHDSAWRRYKGKRLLTLWTNYGDLKDPQGKPLPFKETIDALLARIGRRESVFLVLYCPDKLKLNNPDWFAGADAFTDWLNIDYGWASQRRVDDEALVKASGKEFWYPVMPSFTQARPGLKPNVREKLGMANFSEDWLAAIKADAPTVCIPTWNDLTEDSALMPESNHAAAYSELNRYYARWFETGQPPAVEREEVLLFHHPQVVEGLQLPAGREPMGSFPWARTTPPTDYIGVVGLFKQPARVIVKLGRKTLGEKELPAGMNQWLLYHPQDKQGGRHPDAPPVYPAERPGLFITKLSNPFTDADVYILVYRGEQRIGLFRSHRPIAGAAGRGEMQTIGDVFVTGEK